MYFIIQFTYIYIFSLAIFRLLIFLIISFEKLFFVRITFGKIWHHGGKNSNQSRERLFSSSENNLSKYLLSDTATANERLQVPLSLHNFRKYTRAEEVDGTRIHASRKRDPSLCSRISRPSTSRTSSTISSISLPSVWSTRRTSVCGVSWGTWSDISRPGIRFSTNRELYRWVKNFRVIENLFFPVETDVERSSRDVCAICYCTPSDIFKRDRFLYIYMGYRFPRLNGCVKSIITDCWMISGKIAKIIRTINK